MQSDEIRRHSRWVMRVMEWDDARARYPNLWHEGMPRNVLAYDRVVSRLRLGDLVAVYYPTSQKYSARSEKFLGIARVVGLRLADARGYGWIDLETAHRFRTPLALDRQPRRVFMCCDADWPGPEVELFRRVFEAAIAEGWRPGEFDLEPAVEPSREASTAAAAADQAPPPAGSAESPNDRAVPPDARPAAEETERQVVLEPRGRLFAGVNFSGDMRDPRNATWLAVVELRDVRLKVRRLEATGRHGLQGYLRDPDRILMNVEAIGLDFPFGLPMDFAEVLMGGPFPDEGWWALAKRMERMSRPDYLIALQGFRDDKGESKRHTDDVAGAASPLNRVGRDLGPMTYHGIRMIAEDRSRYAVKPFESAQGRMLLEVSPTAFARSLSLGEATMPEQERGRRARIIEALGRLSHLPVDIDPLPARQCASYRDALDAVIAARMAAQAVLSGEAELTPQDLAPGAGDRVRFEGWIYGLRESV